jgi:hypothetical protein
VRIDNLVNVYSYADSSPVIIVYSAIAVGGELCIDDDCLAARVFDRHVIPWDARAFRSTRAALEDYFNAQ